LTIRDQLRGIGKRFELSSRPAARLDRVRELPRQLPALPPARPYGYASSGSTYPTW
jgi:hypothetical protein